MLRLLALSTVLVLLAVVVPAEDSDATCSADGSGANCGAATKNASRGQPTAPKDFPKADLITQELEELNALKQICKDRIALLEDLKVTLNSGVNVSLPESHMKMLQTKLPMMSEIVTAPASTPTGSADDYIISKALIHQQESVSFIKLLPIRSKSSSSGSSPSSQALPISAVLVAAQEDGSVRLFAPSGELVLAFSAGHDQPLTNLAISQSLEDSMILTADAGGHIRVHKVNARLRRQQRANKTADSEVEKVSQYLAGLDTLLNVSAQFSMQMQAPPASDGEPCKITALAVGSQQGGKYFVAGDAEGKVSIFSRNGTFTARVDVSDTPGAKVERLYPHLSNLLFHAGAGWGFVNMEKKMDVHHVECPGFEGSITSLVVDSQKSSRILAADEQGLVWAFNIKDKKNCKVEHSFPKHSTRAPLELASVEGYTIALERASLGSSAASILAINMSHVGRVKETTSAVAWRRGRAAVRDWAILKRHNQGDLIALLSEDGHEVEVLELLMSTQKEVKSSYDSFGNFQMPVIAVAVVLVLGYQYMKQKGKSGGGGGGGAGGGGGKFDASAFGDSDALKKLSANLAAKKKATAGGEPGHTAGPPRSRAPM